MDEQRSLKSAIKRNSDAGFRYKSVLVINPIPVAVEILEGSDPNTDSQLEGRQKFEDVFREYQEDVTTAEANLQAMLKVIYTPDLEMTPWEHFGMKQTCLAGVGILSRIRHKKLTCTDLRDHMENLACLVDLISQYNDRSSGYGAYLLANMCQACGKLGELLEDFSLKKVTDWNKISTHYFDFYKEKMLKPKIPEPFPSMKLFTDPRVIGLGRFTTTFAAKVGSTDVVIKVAYKKKRPINRRRTSHNRKLILNCSEMGCMVRHPSFARMYTTFSTEEAYINIMEYHPGVDLDRVVASAHSLPTTFAMLIVAQICVALEYLHYVGFIHRNVMPSNTIITPRCRIKLIDFSLAKVCSGIFSVRFLPGFRRRTYSEFSDHEMEGDISFQAPEQVRRVAYGRAIDWWALGVTAYQIRFGKLPFRGNSESEQKLQITKGELVFAPDPRDNQFMAYTDFVRLLLKKHPKSRMCSRGYEQYRKHPLYRTLSWKNIETRTEFMEYEPITKLFEAEGATTIPIPEDYVPDPTIITDLREVKDSADQFPLYVYCSESMRTLLQSPSPPSELEPIVDEFLVPFEDAPYKFKDVYKPNRMC